MEMESPSPNLPARDADRDRRSPGADPPQNQDRRVRRAPMQRVFTYVQGKETVLWWLHSTYALLFGLLVMWIGSKNYTYLRVIVFHIGFIWLSSLFLPALVHRSWLSPKWQERVRLGINYFNKNFYQQLLFFLLPIYYASTTIGSRNAPFLGLLAVSAVLSTMDIVYDRYLSVRWQLTAVFFMFNVFASVNVMLPVLWSVSNRWAMYASGLLALGGFASMLYKLSGLQGSSAKSLFIGAALLMLLIVTVLPPFIPPAPLRLANVEFGRAISSLQIVTPLDRLPSGPGKIVALTAVQAPMGLEERVRHKWRLDGRVVYASDYYSVTGGRKEGYRIWTQVTWKKGLQGQVLTVDIETRNGQLIGRATLKAEP